MKILIYFLAHRKYSTNFDFYKIECHDKCRLVCAGVVLWLPFEKLKKLFQYKSQSSEMWLLQLPGFMIHAYKKQKKRKNKSFWDLSYMYWRQFCRSSFKITLFISNLFMKDICSNNSSFFYVAWKLIRPKN